MEGEAPATGAVPSGGDGHDRTIVRFVAWVSHEVGDPTSTRASGRLAAVLFVLCGALVAAAAPLPAGPGAHRLAMLVVGVAALAAGVIVWRLPWERWPRVATLAVVVPLALGLIDAHNIATNGDGFRYSMFYLVLFAWVGLGHPPGTSLRLSPFLVVAYVAPLVVLGHARASVLSSAAYAVPVSVLIGEAAASVFARLRRSDGALRASEARWRSLVMNASDLIVVLSADGIVQYATPAVGRLFGYPADETAGMQVLDLVHPDDVAFVVERLALSLEKQGPGELIEFRVARADGSYTWVESIGTNLLDEPSVRGIVCNVRDIGERKEAEEVLFRQAHTDFLTGLPNRLAFLDAVAGRSHREAAPFALLLMDLDRFKEINDALGHATGDLVLREIAARLPVALPATATVARLGGDEFAIAIDTGSEAEAELWAARLCRLVDEPVNVEQMTLRLGASIGVAWSGGAAVDVSSLLRRADVAMYRAKSSHTGWAVYEPADDQRAPARLALAHELRVAVDAGTIDVHYQPQVDLRTGKVGQVEALARWTNNGLPVPPDVFIPLAEGTGLIGRLTDVVLDQALVACRRWSSHGTPVSVAVNVSAISLADPLFADTVGRALARAGVPGASLTLEVTESALAEDLDAIASALGRLRALGVRLSIDDFGTGYSAMAYLKRLPIHELKIDRSFVVDLDTDPRDGPIARSIIELAHGLGLTVVGEGVESAQLGAALAGLGCDAVQGYWVSRPMPGDQLGAWLDARRSIDLTAGAIAAS